MEKETKGNAYYLQKIKGEIIKNKVKIGLILLITIMTIITIIMFWRSSLKLDYLPLLNEEINLEYGQTVALDPVNYIDLESFNFESNEEIEEYLSKVKIETDAVNESIITKDDNDEEVIIEKDYPAVGEYEVNLTYENSKKSETKSVRIIVVDTVAPTFSDDFKESINITKDCPPTLNSLSEQFKAEDLSDVMITIDDSQVDYTNIGEYVAIVKAIDASNNIAERETHILVISPTIQLNTESESIYVNENVALNTTIVGKDQQAIYTSEDKSIATVDQNGKVAGVKAGTAKITATANGVSATCQITVKNPTISLNKKSLSLYVGNSSTLTSTVTGASKNVTYKSSDTSVATVNGSGKVVGVKAGTAKITATANGVSAVCEVTVSSAAIYNLAVPYYNQNSWGIPTGCEGVSLLQAFHYKGYATGYNPSTFLAEMPIAPDDNPYNGFIKSPFERGGLRTIMPSKLASWGSNYGIAVDISGSNVSTLIEEIKKGNPVVVWVTSNYAAANWKSYSWGTVPTNMHVVTLSGYNEATGEYKVTDPSRNNQWVSKSNFERAYNYLKYAVVVR